MQKVTKFSKDKLRSLIFLQRILDISIPVFTWRNANCCCVTLLWQWFLFIKKEEVIHISITQAKSFVTVLFSLVAAGESVCSTGTVPCVKGGKKNKQQQKKKNLSDSDCGAAWLTEFIWRAPTFSCFTWRTCWSLRGLRDFQRLDWAAVLKVRSATKNLSLWQTRLDGCHLSPADHAGRDMCSPRAMRSRLAFHSPAVTFTHCMGPLHFQTPLQCSWLSMNSHTLHLLGCFNTHWCSNYYQLLLWLSN